MRRRRRRGGDDGITLFPFLAVLICTVGSLIVLLVVVVQQAKANAATVSRQRESQREAQQQLVKQLREKKDEFRWRIEILESSRQQTAEQLEDRRRELSHLENEIRQLSDKLDAAIDEAKRIAQTESNQEARQAASEQQVAELRQRLRRAEQDLELAREALAKRKPSYSIVPYDGPHGTQRRPLFVECKGDRVILQPEGVELYGVDFQQPITDDNPLAAALRAKREYLGQVFREQDNRPYPLLIVRPDGAQAYAAARTAMKSWDAEFGYELVDRDFNLKYPQRDPALVKVVQEAVEEARFQRQQLQSIAPSRFGRQSPATFTASRNGGFVRSEGGGGPAVGQPPFGEGSGRPNPYGAPGGNGIGNSPGSSHPPDGQELHAFGAPGPIRSRGPAGTAISAQGARSDNSFADEGGSGGFGGGNQGSGDRHDGGAFGGQGRDDFRGAGRGGEGDARSPYEPEPSDVAGLDSPRGTANENGSLGSGTSSGGQGQPAAGKSASSGSPHFTGSRASSAAGSTSSQGSSTAGGSSASGARPGSSLGAQGQPNAGLGSMSVAASAMNAAPPQPIADARGADWGLPSGSQGAVGITRPIPVVLSGRYLEILPEDRRGRPVRLDLRGSLQDEMDELISTLWSRMDNWGIAGAGMYWKPVLSIRVHPSGEQRYQELARLLQNSGIVVERKN